MKKLRLYFATSVYNFAIDDSVPAERMFTLKLLEEIKGGKYEVFISEVVTLEINRAPEEIAAKLRDVLNQVTPEDIAVNQDVQELAKEYIQKGVIPKKYENDALHIAVATVHNLDVIISWNFEHIVKMKTKRQVNAINTLSGYKEVDIYTPREVVENV